MISEIIYKLNAFDSNFVALSEINNAENAKKTPTIGELQKKYGEFLPIALEQIKLNGKVKKKLPAWVNAKCLFEQRAFEQCTSQRVAEWKANFFNTSRLLSLTGGFGVDDWAWVKTGAQVISTDPNKELNHLVRCNMQRLMASDNPTYTRWDLTAEDFLSNPEFHSRIPSLATKKYMVYMDPDRRKGDERLGGNAKAFTPNFVEIIKAQFTEFKTWLIKLSPMTDVHFLQKELPYPIRFYSIFYQGEVKELLLELGEGIEKTEFKSVYLTAEHYEIWDAHLMKSWFKMPLSDSTLNLNNHTYFFEPHGGLNCLGLNREIDRYLMSVNSGKTFYLSSFPLPNSLGRSLKINTEVQGSLKQIKQHLLEINIQKASLTARECKGINATEIQKKLGLKEGGNHTLFITQKEGSFRCWICENTEI